jgi:50S ribosomal subunit-associated GTPase HflX
LAEIGLDHIPRLVVFNKVDLVNRFWAKALARRFHGVHCSAINRDTFGDLLKEIEKRVWTDEDQGNKVEEQTPDSMP